MGIFVLMTRVPHLVDLHLVMLLPVTALLFSLATALPVGLTKRSGNMPVFEGGYHPISPNITGAYPRSTNKLDDGSTLGACTLSTNGPDSELVLKHVKSTDGGQTWASSPSFFLKAQC